MLLSETSSSVRWKVVKDLATTGSSDYEVGLNLREKNTAYKVGDIVFDEQLPTYIRLRCVTAGTSSNRDLPIY